MLLAQQPRVQYLAFQKIHFDVAKIYHQRWLDESEQRLENVDQAGAIKKRLPQNLRSRFLDWRKCLVVVEASHLLCCHEARMSDNPVFQILQKLFQLERKIGQTRTATTFAKKISPAISFSSIKQKNFESELE